LNRKKKERKEKRGNKEKEMKHDTKMKVLLQNFVFLLKLLLFGQLDPQAFLFYY